MQRQRVSLQPAYLLHQSPYRDSSRLLELMTRDYGRVGLVARGVRRPRARLRPLLQPFRPLLMSWTSRGDLGTLTGAEAVPGLASVPARSVYSAYYMNELLVRLTRRHDAHPRLFGQYAEALRELCERQPEARVLRLFEKRLLDELGYGLDLRRTVDGNAVRDHARYEYRLEHGVVEAADPASGEMIFAGKSLLSLAAERLEGEDEIRDARRLLRYALGQYLGPRPLAVRHVARAIRRGLR